MHELAMAEAVLQVALAHTASRPDARIARVGLQVGHLRQVVPSSLRFNFMLVAEGTIADGAELEIEEVPAIARCRACGVESRQAAFPLHCEGCGALDVAVVRGEELLVDWLELETEDEAATAPAG